MTAPYEDLLLEEPSPGVVLVTLNRPERLNALRWETYAELERFAGETTARAVVITGAGRGFCSGDDVTAIMGDGHIEVEMPEEPHLDPTTRALLELRCPVIAAVNGPAAGWGLDLALLADLRLASRSAFFAPLYVDRGQCPDVATLGRLWQLIGRERATRLLLTDERLDAERALEWGLVSEVLDDGALVPRALELAALIADKPPLAVAAVKEGLRRASEPDHHELGRWAATQHASLFRSADQREAIQAFVEGRRPEFRGC